MVFAVCGFNADKKPRASESMISLYSSCTQGALCCGRWSLLSLLEGNLNSYWRQKSSKVLQMIIELQSLELGMNHQVK